MKMKVTLFSFATESGCPVDVGPCYFGITEISINTVSNTVALSIQ